MLKHYINVHIATVGEIMHGVFEKTTYTLTLHKGMRSLDKDPKLKQNSFMIEDKNEEMAILSATH